MKEFEDLKELLHEEDTNFNKTIEKTMDKKISKKVFKNILLIVLTAFLITSGFHFFALANNYNPKKEDIKFEYLLQSYLWLYHPGITYHQSGEIETGLFANYTFMGEFDNEFIDKGMYDNLREINVRQNKMDMSYLYEKYYRMGNARIAGEWDSYEEYNLLVNEKKKNNLLYELSLLPDSAYIDCTLLFAETKTLDEVIEFMNYYPNTNFMWIAMETYEYLQTGVSGIPLYRGSGTKVELEEYPNLFKWWQEEKYTVEGLTNVYHELLEIMLDHRKAYTMFIDGDVNRQYLHLENQYEYAQENLNSIGLKIYTNKKDLINMIQNGECLEAYIRDIKLSSLV